MVPSGPFLLRGAGLSRCYVLDLQLFAAIVSAILGLVAVLTIRGLVIRMAVFAIALLAAAYIAGWRPPLAF